MQHVLAASQFDTRQLSELFTLADQMREMDSVIEGRQELVARYAGERLCSLFYEPSTRTRLSFETAAAAFGMGVVSTENAREFSSAAKGEIIQDTIKVLNEYGYAAIVLRHHETGAAADAAAASDVPIINAGDGKGEHPTQSLLDAYTIQEQLGRLDGLRVVIGGDLKHGRTARSLAQMLSKYSGNHIDFVSTPEMQIGKDIKNVLDANNTSYEETTEMYDALKTADVVYWTRIQKERMEKPESKVISLATWRRWKSGGRRGLRDVLSTRTTEVEADERFKIDATALAVMKEDAIIMHPLPRVGEIDYHVDQDPRAKYFRQAGNGLYVRMALIDTIIQTQWAATSEEAAA